MLEWGDFPLPEETFTILKGLTYGNMFQFNYVIFLAD